MPNSCLCCRVAIIAAVMLVTAKSSTLLAQPSPYAPAIEAPAVEAPPMATPRPVPDGRFHVQLKDGSLLVGKFAEDDQLKLKSVLGTVDIPVKKVSGVFFEKDRTAKVTFRNNDTLSGELQAPALAMETSFGEVKIQLGTIVAIIRHEQFANSGTVTQRVIRKTEDGEVIEWQTHSVTSPYRSPASYNGGYAPASTPSTTLPAPPSAAYPAVPAPAGVPRFRD